MSNIGAVILAAGASARLGQPKQLVTFRGKSLLQHAVTCALAATDHVIVVSGTLHDILKTELKDSSVRIFHNPDWEVGMSSSVRTGLEALPPNMDGALFLVCDQPMISQELLTQMTNIFLENPARIVACKYGDTFGTPVVFPQMLFNELRALNGPEGAKKVIKDHPAIATFVDFPDGLLDIDTPEQLQLLNQNNSF